MHREIPRTAAIKAMNQRKLDDTTYESNDQAFDAAAAALRRLLEDMRGGIHA